MKLQSAAMRPHKRPPVSALSADKASKQTGHSARDVVQESRASDVWSDAVSL
jgi:hypothetical protein